MYPWYTFDVEDSLQTDYTRLFLFIKECCCGSRRLVEEVKAKYKGYVETRKAKRIAQRERYSNVSF